MTDARAKVAAMLAEAETAERVAHHGFEASRADERVATLRTVLALFDAPQVDADAVTLTMPSVLASWLADELYHVTRSREAISERHRSDYVRLGIENGRAVLAQIDAASGAKP